MRLGIALAWHHLTWPQLVGAVRLAEDLGFQAALIDGDVTQLASRGDHTILEGWTATASLLAKTNRIEIGSIRLVHHWNAARLAQAVATLDHIEPNRLRFIVSIGGQPADRRFGFPTKSPSERIQWLDETLTVARKLWNGELVDFQGRFVQLSGAKVRPAPGNISIQIAARSRRLLELVARHGDRWDINLPPLSGRVQIAEQHLAAACKPLGRNPSSIKRSMWLFTRVGAKATDSTIQKEYRRLNPWFSDIADNELPKAIIAGSPEECVEQIRTITSQFHLDLPIVDFSGLTAEDLRHQLKSLANASA